MTTFPESNDIPKKIDGWKSIHSFLFGLFRPFFGRAVREAIASWIAPVDRVTGSRITVLICFSRGFVLKGRKEIPIISSTILILKYQFNLCRIIAQTSHSDVARFEHGNGSK